LNIAEVEPGDRRLAGVYEVMKELRPHLSREQFEDLFSQTYADGYRVAAVFDGNDCRACAGYRLMTNLVSGRHMYVDDLVTAEHWRSHGYGRLLNKYLVDLARNQDCTSVQLDSNTRRSEAHRFYFRERYTISAFHFVRAFER
jgi:GNAT superfamily N-acetyltransferase